MATSFKDANKQHSSVKEIKCVMFLNKICFIYYDNDNLKREVQLYEHKRRSNKVN